HDRRLWVPPHLASFPGTAACRLEVLFCADKRGTRSRRRPSRIGIGEMAIPRRGPNRIDGTAQFAGEETQTETTKLERRGFVPCFGTPRTGSSALDRSVPPGDAYLSGRRGRL